MKSLIPAAAIIASPAMATSYLCDATTSNVDRNNQMIGHAITIRDAATVTDYGNFFVIKVQDVAITSAMLGDNGMSNGKYMSFMRRDGQYMALGGGVANMASNCRKISK